MKVLKIVNLHLEYVPGSFRNQMQKKVEYKLTSKTKKNEKKPQKADLQADTLGMKIGKIVHYYYLKITVKKNNGTYQALI